MLQGHLTLWLVVLAVWAGCLLASDDSVEPWWIEWNDANVEDPKLYDCGEKVLRCRTKIQDSGKRTPSGKRIFRLVRDRCSYEPLFPEGTETSCLSVKRGWKLKSSP